MNPKLIMFFMAILVIASFVSVGVAIGVNNYPLAVGLFLLGFILMGFGLRLKKKII